MGITQATGRTETPSNERRLDVTDFRAEQVAAFAAGRDADRVFFERKGPRTYLVTE